VKILDASYAVSLAVAKEKKPHTIGEMLLKLRAKKWLKSYWEKMSKK